MLKHIKIATKKNQPNWCMNAYAMAVYVCVAKKHMLPTKFAPQKQSPIIKWPSK